ncbi:M48 family metallopeptidase [Clostridium tetani]|uniref:M48 family metallopeptidase n=1 Tax=Clostridium tetani TaxID=1513 RepID=UPI00100AA02D|nr:SprT family zinc-dependent metalloprotease [Clostridium tetani]RXM57024.1 hypothetical protein DP133_11860 [Clostridium tetani]
MKCEKHSIKYENKIIEYTLYRKKVKNINLRIKRDGSVFVSAKHNVPIDYINKFLESKGNWIIKNIEFFINKQDANIENNFEENDEIIYLGNEYILKIIPSKEDNIVYDSRYIYLHTKYIEEGNKKKEIYEEWLRKRAKEVFGKSLDKMYLLIENYEVEKPDFSIRKMKSTWGSCMKYKNKINLNLYLMKTEETCIDYVVLHELVHLVHFNHSKDFYDLLDDLMPDWKERKRILNSK